MEATIYNKEGKEAGKVKLPKGILDLPWNEDLVFQATTTYLANKRAGTAHTKDRKAVRGGGKKPWRQKGTGRARHGSSRSPIWVGGGVTHGPNKAKVYSKKMNKKMKTKALLTILSRKHKDGEILFIEDLDFKAIKTKDAADFLMVASKIKGFDKIHYKKGNRAVISTPKKTEGLLKSFRNIKSTYVNDIANINPLDVMNYKYLVISKPEESLEVLSNRIKK